MRKPVRTFVAIAAMVAGALFLGSGALFLTLATQAPQSQAQEQDLAQQEDAEAPDAPPLPAAQPADAGDMPRVVDSEWLDATAESTGIPRRALQAYVGAAVWAGENQSSCGLGWNTLAAVGEVETNHGRTDGSRIEESGDVSKPIIGARLDGRGVREIEDTDDGELDDDGEFDRAVGPMQFIPQSWAAHSRDGNGDGVEDPQNIDDAAITAAAYLCTGGSLSSAPGWEKAVMSYNSSLDYVEAVRGSADRIASAAGVARPAPPAETVPATPSPSAAEQN